MLKCGWNRCIILLGQCACSYVLNMGGVNFMDVENNIDPLVSMQQELCDMWGINNQTKENSKSE